MTAPPFNRHAVTTEDRRQARFEAIDTRIREDRAQVEMVDEAISEDLSDYPGIVSELADASETGLIKAIAEGRELTTAQCDVFARLARRCDAMAAEREKRLQAKVESEFELSERDTRDGDDFECAA